MSKVIDSISQPPLRRQGIHMEAKEEEKQTHGSLELLRLFRSSRVELLAEALKTRVDGVVSLDPDIRARLRQGHRHPVDTPVSDEDK